MAARSPTAPLIQVTSDQKACNEDMAKENPVFMFDDVKNEPLFPSGSESSKSRRSLSLTSACSSQFWNMSNASSRQLSLYSSSVSTPKMENTLAVPGRNNGDSRRHSLASSIDIPVTPRGSGSHLSIDHVINPRRVSRSRSMTSTWSEFVAANRRSTCSSPLSNFNTSHMSGMSSAMSERLMSLLQAFSRRTQIMKEKTLQPPTPSSCSSLAKSTEPPAVQRHRLDSYVHMESRMGSRNDCKVENYCSCGRLKCRVPAFFTKFKIPKTFDPNGYAYLFWLFLVTLAYMYNVTVIALRSSFPYQTDDNLIYWLVCDYTADVIYLVDIFVVKIRLKFVKNGLIEEDPKEARHHYLRKIDFKLDILSLLPFDFFYFLVGVNPLLRLPRFLKLKTFWEFYDRCDHVAKNGHIVRVMRTVTYMIYLIHLETCGYYSVSVYEGINSTRWVYNGKGNAYIRCFYLATKTATSIGNNPKPTNELEWMFMTLYWLSGVFVFALLIGQIRDIYTAASANRVSFRKNMDATLHHMQNLNVPKELQNKVRTWFNYTWSTQKTLDENSLLQVLPQKLVTDIAISVHFDTLSQVQLFQDCDKNLLFDLVSKLRPVLYLPGDNIITKGEVGTEMYIVVHGLVEVVAPTGQVLATLGKGSVFGEISLLALAGGNRRTATVQSKGFSNVFKLCKSDFERAMRDYPDAQALLKKRAKKLLAINAKTMKQDKQEMVSEEVINHTSVSSSTPKLLKTVVKVIDPESKVMKWLRSKGKSSTWIKGKSNNRLKAKNSSLSKQTEMESGDDGLPNYSENLESLSDDEDEVLIVEQTEMDVPTDPNNDDDGKMQDIDEMNDKECQEEIDRIMSSCSTPKHVQSPAASHVTPPPNEQNSVESRTCENKSKASLNSDKPSSGRTGRQSKSSLNSAICSSPFTKRNVICPMDTDIADILRSPGKPQNQRSKSVIDFSKRNKVEHFNPLHCTWDGVNMDRNDIPMDNKILCSVEVHREPSVSPQGHNEESFV